MVVIVVVVVVVVVRCVSSFVVVMQLCWCEAKVDLSMKVDNDHLTIQDTGQEPKPDNERKGIDCAS